MEICPWRVYLSDGYPQATAGSTSSSRRGAVYLSDGYPQATAVSEIDEATF